MDLNKLISVYIKMRDKKSELVTAHKEEVAKLDENMDKIKYKLLDYCKETNQEGGRTDSGSFYRSVKTKYWTGDWESMHKFILDKGELNLLERRIQQTNMGKWLDENPDDVPAGLNTNHEYTIVVKKPKS